jgi:VCBS repeat-containing protein
MTNFSGTIGNDVIIGTFLGDAISAGNGDDTIAAGEGNNWISAEAGNDRVTAGSGNDVVHLGDGNNTLDAGNGNNWVGAGSGNDIINAGSGNDVVHAGDGNNTVSLGDGENWVAAGSGRDVVTAGSGNDVVHAGDGNNTVTVGDGNNWVGAGSGNDVINAGSGNDVVHAGDGNNTVSLGDGENWVAAGRGHDVVTAGSGNDDVHAGDGNNTVNAGDGNNWIGAGSGNDIINAGSGNDVVHAGDGNDSLYGGAGSDFIFGDAGNDQILYGRGLDTVLGGDGDDLIDDAPGYDSTQDRSLVFGDAGNDTIFGTASHDTLIGGTGNDLVKGESGDDRLFGDDGNDSLFGDAGHDLIDGGAGSDLIFGDAGNDHILYGRGHDTVFGGDGDDLIDDAPGFDATHDRSLVFGGAGQDTIFGTASHDTLFGGAGNDLINDESGDDVVFGDFGNDSLHGGAGNDLLDGGQGADLIYGGAGNDTLDGGGNPDGESDTIFGGAGDDSILPGAGGADLLYGGDGRDTLSGGLDADALHGDAGDDVLYADQATGGTSLEGADSLYGGDGNDTLILNANANLRGGLALGGNGNDTAFGSAQGDVIDGGQGADLIYGGAGNDTLDGGGNPDGEIDTIFGGAGDDSILPGAGGADLLYGGDGRDTLSGGLDADALHGDAGDDVLYADQATGGTSLEGADSLYGGDGNDTLILNANANLRGGLALGGNGNDTAFGSGQGDVIDGGQGADLIYGGAGNDTLDGGGNPDGEIDTIFGGAGDDSILPGAGGADLLYGGDGRDTLSGGLDADALHGDAGDDVLYADQATGGTSLEGADSLYGGDGNDTLILNANANLRGGLALGGNGNDTAFGSAQGDVIDGGAGNDQLFGGAGDDIIRGFDGFGSDIAIGGESGEVAGDLVDLTSMTTATVLTFTGSEAGTITSAGAAMTFSEFEQVNLGSGDDIVIGDVGDNVANAGAGNDSLNGGAGSDTLGGGEGDDLFTQTLAQNAGANDRFDGGAGSDELHLDVTAAEWANPLFQTDVAAFLAHIASGSPAPFSFASTGLTVTSIERFTINIDGVPTDPVNASVTAAAQTVAAGEDGAAVAVNLLANAIVDDRAGSVQVLGTSAFGTVSVVTDLLATPQTAVLIFTPNAATQALRDGEVVTEVLSYSITDVDGSTATSSVTITLTGANDTATITGLSVGGLEESALSPVSGTLTVADVDTGEAVLQTPANLVGVYGTFTVDTASGAWSYTPNTGSPALESLAAGTQVTDQITVASLDGTASQTITITITGTNDAPTLAAGVLASVEDGPSVTLDLTALGDDIDAGEDGASLLYSLTTPPSVGTASVANGVLTYSVGTAFQSLAQGDEETVTLTVTATDAFGAQASNTVTITITGTNDAPTVAASLTAAATEDGSAVSLNLLAGAADVDNGAVLSVANVTGLVAGVTLSGATLSVDPSNAAFQSLALGQTRVITVSYDVTDETGASVPQTATITVTGTNDAPTVAASLTAAATEDGSAVSLNLLAGAADVDNGAVLSVANVTGLVAGVTLSGATLSIDPSNAAFQSLALGQTRVITVNYDVTDETGAAVPQTATITVTGTNDAPTVAASLTAAATEDGSAVSLNLLAGAADVDNGAVLSVANVTGLVAGVTLSGATLSIDPSNAAFQSLALGQTRVITVSYDVTDEAGASVPQTATITVTGTNDAPTVAASLTAAATEDASAVSLNLLAGAADVDTGAVLSVANVTGLVAGVTLSGATLSVDPSNAAFQSLALGQTRVITVSYDVTDEAGASVAQTATITVTGTNDVATITGLSTGFTAEDNPSNAFASGTLQVADPDAGQALLVAQSNVAGSAGLGTFNVAANGAWTYQINNANPAVQALNNGQTVVDRLIVRSVDGTATQEISVAVNGRDEPVTGAVNIDVAAMTAAQGFRVFGADAGDQAGYSVSSAGDINGDGFDDMIIGAITGDGSTNTKNNAGEAIVVFGKATGFGNIDPSAANFVTSGQGFRIFGADAFDQSGWSVSSAGDINGDGFDDLIIGARGGDGSANTKPSAGEAIVVFGKATGFGDIDVSAANFATSGQGFRIFGADFGDQAGQSVSSAGDINGDGLDDLIIGARSGDGSAIARNDAGEAIVVFGKATGFGDIDVSAPNFATSGQGFRVFGEDVADFAGVSVSSAGDVNGDGFDDLIIGAQGSDGSTSFIISRGEAFVVFGKATGFGNIDVAATNLVTSGQGFRVFGADPYDQAGLSVSSAGDINGDGFDDLIIGAFGADDPTTQIFDRGEAIVVFGKATGFGDIDVSAPNFATSGQGFRVFGEDVADFAGVSVSSAGDVNGDGFDDLIIGAQGSDGSANSKSAVGEAIVVFGKAAGFGDIDLSAANFATSGQGFRIFGADAYDRAGFSVSSAGDINGDGFDDLIIGAPAGDGSANARANTGEAIVIFGGNFLGNTIFAGTNASDALTGTAAAETFVGGLGNDTLVGNGGADVFQGGAGNDTIAVRGTSAQRIDGGSGFDILRLDASADSFDFATILPAKITSIEAFDLTGTGNNNLRLSAQDVFDLSDDTAFGITKLTIFGDRGDSVSTIDTGWANLGTTTIGADSFQIYQKGQAQLLVDTDITVVGILG